MKRRAELMSAGDRLIEAMREDLAPDIRGGGRFKHR
jgi:hypothetical protein